MSDLEELLYWERTMDDLLKNLRALARGKHDDFSVALEAVEKIETLRLLVSDLAKYLYLISDEDDTEVAELLKRYEEVMK